MDQIIRWAEYFKKVYGRKPTMAERESYMIGRIDEMQDNLNKQADAAMWAKANRV